ncbi:betaine/proline/choline family ABC transporter ATP-binding protein [Weissella paramesenteroides]|uniref:Quaternary amine transport ATP-binding protein n=1 Tax=Weissella thailandensis TaxID=89061 RepID=A0ABX9I248_9LACO|nr:betaine/proline/choline family ABC transporter ATP-binding protein [Weissella thailandensis]NKY90248.1 betaine/proline/choline family ABC transporter ATP-binding protein [Weissella thailandensis]RDS58692.1 ATP-binding cassette domain-containing protein [Weissella thailandensis]GEP75555.1 glycine/betaine ABC transporter ATP-binding protein [Weissella thailandensis]
MEDPILVFKDVKKVYRGGSVGIEGVNLTINKGDFVCLIGTSGSGKTTTMRMINRMHDASSGQILFNGKDIKNTDPVSLRRKIGYVIQNIGLMPHMTIYDNITLVPRLLKWPEEKKRQKAEELCKEVELPEEFLDRYPSQLSGGQQQRVGVIRALAADQDLILMDEPFGALDPITRESLQDLVSDLQKRLNKTIVFVTHDIDEALRLATKIVIMDGGKIVQNASPEEILQYPANDFVKNLLGEERLSQAKADLSTVDQIMLKDPVKVTLGHSIPDSIRLMRERRVDTLLVVDDENYFKGYVDIDTITSHYRRATSVSDLLSTDMPTVANDTLVRQTVRKMLNREFKYLPVVDYDNKLLGIVNRTTMVDVVYDTIWGNSDDNIAEKEEDQAKYQETATVKGE